MKPVHVVVLLLAGALGGAMIMKVAHPGKPAVSMPTVAQVQAPPPVQPPEPALAPQPAPAVQAPPAEPEPAPAAIPEQAKPSPMPVPVRREAPKTPRYRPVTPPAGNPVPLERPVAPPAAEPVPVERPVTLPAAEPAPAIAQVIEAPSPSSPAMAPPSASTEPEHTTPGSPQVSMAPAPQPHQVTLNTGLLLPVRLVDGLSSERNVPGDVFLATLDKELVVDGFVIAERGARVEGRVVAADRGGKVTGVAALAVELTSLHTSDGQAVTIATDSFFKHAEANHADDAAKVVGGAVIGAAIGAIAAGGKGAAIGAGVGGGAGAGGVLLTRRRPAELPTETRVTFRLKSPLPLTERLR